MATYPIKMLKDEENTPFVPLVSTDCIRDENNQTLQQILDKKLSPTNLLGGDYVNITTEGNNCYVSVDLPANLNVINNLSTTSAGQGALDAYQGKVLKDSIPLVVNDLSSTSTTNALSANQGYILNNKFNNYLPLTGGTISGTITANNYIGKTNNMIWELGTEDKENTWVPVMVEGVLKHRVIPTTYNTTSPTLDKLIVNGDLGVKGSGKIACINGFYADYAFTKTLNITEIETWYDTGIIGANMNTGTYIMEVYINSWQVNSQWNERLSGVVAWFNGGTNSTNADDIPLSKSGHARNNHNIRLRLLRQANSSDGIKLQICDSIAWTGSGDITFRFKKIL